MPPAPMLAVCGTMGWHWPSAMYSSVGYPGAAGSGGRDGDLGGRVCVGWGGVGMDRTAEFFSTVESLRVAGGIMAAARPLNPPGVKADASDHARFTAAVAILGKEIHATSLKLQEMTKRAWAAGYFLCPAPDRDWRV